MNNLSFINICTVFDNQSQRNLEYLKNIYNDVPKLKEKIKLLIFSELNASKINSKRVLLKPNWVLHNQKNEDEFCLRTNDSFLIATLEVILEQNPTSIVVGDAPIQGCNWDKMLNSKLLNKIESLSKSYNIPISVKDFRRTTFDPQINNQKKDIKPLLEYLIFDLGEDSYLEPISSKKNKFRVTDYDPDRLVESHTMGMHKYCITKELFEADLVISMPKIKTHQKAGITGALKNLVGLNGDKDFLPHHRIGGIGFGGDCYPGKNILRRISEWLIDIANRHHGERIYWYLRTTALVIWKLSFPNKTQQLGASWYGNDTVWRMVMDLNKIAVYGKKDGTLSKNPQREIYSLCDAIIGGQGEGPLNPDPLPLGVICFSNNNSMSDICMATLMGFNIHKISLLESAYQNIKLKSIDITLNGSKVFLSDLFNLSILTTPPSGWVDYLSTK